jgi:hypothetical protein
LKLGQTNNISYDNKKKEGFQANTFAVVWIIFLLRMIYTIYPGYFAGPFVQERAAELDGNGVLGLINEIT